MCTIDILATIKQIIQIIDLARAGLESQDGNRQSLENKRPKLVNNLKAWGEVIGVPTNCQSVLDKLITLKNTLYSQLVSENFLGAFSTLDEIISTSTI